MKKWIIKTFGLKGSWKWAKKQMMNGEIVRCEHWAGSLKLKIDSPEITLLQFNFTTHQKTLHVEDKLWETANHHLSYEEFTDYVVFRW